MEKKFEGDIWLIIAMLSLLALGWIMVFSSSLAYSEAQGLGTLHFAKRQTIAFLLGGLGFLGATYIQVRFWQKIAPWLLILSILALIIVLIPGVTRPVNGSLRWIFIGPFSLQVSEFAKLAFIIYLSDFLVRRKTEVETKVTGLLKPLLILSIVSLFLLLEPDFGTIVVMTLTTFGLLFLGGVPFRNFVILGILSSLVLGLVLLSSPYRVIRLTTFLNPWDDQYNTGYQLTQSLIAFGRGGWFGEGLGNSIQKLLYLPEPHTDFLYAILAEELGLMGALCVLSLFALLIWRIFRVGRNALHSLPSQAFGGFVAYGIGLWISAQAMINIGVNVGVLPTKGITLPLMSYGGNSVIVLLFGLGLLFRIDFENRLSKRGLWRNDYE